MANNQNQQEALLELALKQLDDLLMARVTAQELPAELQDHQSFLLLYEKIAGIRQYSMQLANGDLSQNIKQKGYLAGVIRNLQANLRHLSWQTQMVAAGDLSQRVDFMGDFSEAFNAMIDSLAHAEAALKASEARYRLLAENALDILWTIDLEGVFTYVSPAAARYPAYLLGAEGKAIHEVMSAQAMRTNLESLYRALHDENLARQGLVFETVLSGEHQADVILKTTVSALQDDNGSMIGLLGVARDISEHKRMQKELLQMATMDALTCIANRRFFMQLGEEEVNRSVRYGHTFSVLILDIDYFKRINDNYGHPVGDEVLRNLAAIGSRTLRSADTMGRLGGEEFGVILTETGIKSAVLVAERLRRAFEAAVLTLEDGRTVTFTVSIGVANKQDLNESFDHLLKKADHALYDAKNSGRNRVCIAS